MIIYVVIKIQPKLPHQLKYHSRKVVHLMNRILCPRWIRTLEIIFSKIHISQLVAMGILIRRKMSILIRLIKCKVVEIMLIREISMKKLGNEEIQVGRFNKKTIEMLTKEMSILIHITSLNKIHIATQHNTKIHTTIQANIKIHTTNQPHTRTWSQNTTTQKSRQ